jgi:hypothetical protein
VVARRTYGHEQWSTIRINKAAIAKNADELRHPIHDYFIGLMDFFFILLPGELLTYLLMGGVGTMMQGDRYDKLAGSEAWVASCRELSRRPLGLPIRLLTGGELWVGMAPFDDHRQVWGHMFGFWHSDIVPRVVAARSWQDTYGRLAPVSAAIWWTWQSVPGAITRSVGMASRAHPKG